MYEDWTAETFGLLVRISDETSGPDNGTACLLQAFNNQEIMSSIIMHFRVRLISHASRRSRANGRYQILTSAWLRTNPDAYLPFCQDATIEQYCASKIDPFQVELDHLGLQALIDVVIKPAQFGLEVSCLDLSVGTEMNTLKWNTGDLSSPRWIIRLLYRPGHYDILYKAEDIPQGLLNNPQVHRMSYAALPTFASTALAQYTYSGLVSDDAWQPSNAPVDDWAHDHLSYLLQNDPYSPIHPASTPTSAHFGHTADQTSLSSQPDSLAFSVAPGHLHPHQVPSYSPWTPHSNCSDMTTSSVLSSAPLTSVPAGSHSPQPNSLAFSVAPGHLHPHQVPSYSPWTPHSNCSDMTISSFSNSAPLISVPAGSLSQKPVDPFRKTEWNRRLSARTTKRTYRKSGKGRCAPASVSRFSGGKHHFKNRNFQPEHYEPE